LCNARSATTRLDFAPRRGEQAGLVCYYDTDSYLKLALIGTETEPCLIVEERRRGVTTRVAESKVGSSRPLLLRVQVEGLSRVFTYSVDGTFWEQVATIPDARFLSDQGTPQWGFTGTMVGVFSVGGGCSSGLSPADFDWFHHQPRNQQ
jgi:xylan 1,4-beta-xylosidase